MRSASERWATSGFTLVEVLVVTVLLAVLAALLFPVFLSAMEAVQQTTCRSNLKQIGAAFLLYASDWDGSFPNPGGQRQYNPAMGWCEYPRNGWVQSAGPGLGRDVGGIWPYVRTRSGNPSDNLWSCPKAIPGSGRVFSPGQNYIMNDYLRRQHPGEEWGRWPCRTGLYGYFDGVRLQDLARPDHTILIYEGSQRQNGSVARSGSPYFSLSGSSAHAPWPPNAPVNYHHGRATFLFCDGHARALRPEATWTTATNQSVRTLNPRYHQALQEQRLASGSGSEDLWNPVLAGVTYP